MTQHFSSRAGGLIVAAFLACTACDDGGSGPRTNQLVSSPTAALAVRVSPFQLQLSPIVASGCPVSQPFMTNLDLVVGPFSTDLFLDAVTLRFDNANGGLLLFTRDDLDSMFGTRFIAAHSTKVFRIEPRFGCGLSTRPRSLTASVASFDGRGQRHEANASAVFE